MYTSFMQVTPGTIRIKLEVSWGTASTDYAEACALFRNMPVPGFSNGEAPAIITAEHFSREIRAETIRRCAARLIHSILMEKGIRTVGPLLILQASLEPGQKFHCVIELLLRPEVSLPDCDDLETLARNDDTRRAEVKQWLLAHTECDVPEPIIRRSLEPASRDTAQPGSMLWAEAAHNALLHVIAHEVADQNGIVVDENRLREHLEEIAAATNTTPEKLRAAYNKSGQMEVIREHLLVGAVLDYLARNETASISHLHATAAATAIAATATAAA
jgi:FKBP-type peptidyl-prolyl cis-trans isomerase (trigger factor)